MQIHQLMLLKEKYTHEIPLSSYCGTGVCLDIPKGKWELITGEDLEEAAKHVPGGVNEGICYCTYRMEQILGR